MRAMPADAAMATSGARSRTPADSSNAPWRVSLPRRRLVALGVDVLAQHRTRSLRERQRLDRQALQVLPDPQVRFRRCEHSVLLPGGPGFEDLDLLVEAVGDALLLIDRRVVLLRLDVLHVGLLLGRSEEHTSELQSQSNLVCRLLLEKKKITKTRTCYIVDKYHGTSHRISDI